MPNYPVRPKGQKLIPVLASDEFMKSVKRRLARLGYKNRSQFIRDAIREKLGKANVEVPAEFAQPPSRKGKGRPKGRVSKKPGA